MNVGKYRYYFVDLPHFINLIFMVNVGKYTIHLSYGNSKKGRQLCCPFAKNESGRKSEVKVSTMFQYIRISKEFSIVLNFFFQV